MGLISFLTSLEGSGPLIVTGMAGKSVGSTSAPTGFTLAVDLGVVGVEVVADAIDPDATAGTEGDGRGVVVDMVVDATDAAALPPLPS